MNGNEQPTRIGLDDGYAYTKVALPGGRVVAIPSRGKIGRANLTWLDGRTPRAAEYEADTTPFTVGDIDGEPTHFDGYPFSGLNRAIVQHALQQAGLTGQAVNAVSGLPVGSFYLERGSQREATLVQKRDSLKKLVQPLDGRAPVTIAFHDVIPEALAAWYDDIIVEADFGVRLDDDRLALPVAVIDIGGRTTDFVIVADEAVRHDVSGSLRCGLLDVKRTVEEGIREKFDLDEVSERIVDRAVATGSVRLFGKTHDITDLVTTAQHLVVERLHAETERRLGRGAELERVLFVGGGAVALEKHIRRWFPNQAIAAEPAFANARGLRKYLQYVCRDTDGLQKN